MTRVALIIPVKLPAEMCQFTRITMNSLNVPFLEKLFLSKYTQVPLITISDDPRMKRNEKGYTETLFGNIFLKISFKNTLDFPQDGNYSTLNGSFSADKCAATCSKGKPLPGFPSRNTSFINARRVLHYLCT